MLFSFFFFGCVSELQNKDFAPTLEVLSQEDEWLINEGESIYLDLLVWDDQITEGGVMVSWSRIGMDCWLNRSQTAMAH